MSPPPSGLLGGEVVGVDEHEFAGVKADRPPPGGARELVLPDPNGMTAGFTEVIDHDPAPFSVRSWVHPYARINRNAICGSVAIASSLGHTSRLKVEHLHTGVFVQRPGFLPCPRNSRRLGFPEP
jgi:hypothetical protein